MTTGQSRDLDDLIGLTTLLNNGIGGDNTRARASELCKSIQADLDTLARIREEANSDVRELTDWLATVPTAIDGQHARRAQALVNLLRAIDGKTEP
jgi:hypothetical protein